MRGVVAAVFFGVLLAAAAPLPAATKSVALVPDEGGETGSELRVLENDFATALVKRDETTLQSLLADGFVYSENDRTMTREALIRELVLGPDKVEGAYNEEMRVHRFGDTAIVTGWLIVRGHGERGAFERRYRFTDTWQKRDGKWKLIAAHDYLAS